MNLDFILHLWEASEGIMQESEVNWFMFNKLTLAEGLIEKM